MKRINKRVVAGTLGVLAIAAGLLVARRWTRSDLDRAWERLPYRPIAARVSGLAYRPIAAASAPASVLDEPRPLSGLRRAALDLLQDESSDADRKGVAFLLAGRPAEAVGALDRCARAAAGPARCWSDLAAAQIELATASDEPRRLALAFAAADRALQLEPRSAEALFNRAMALEAMHLDQPAAVAWQRYLAVDAKSPWAAEGRQRLGKLSGTTRIQLWETAQRRLAAASKKNDLATVHRIVDDYRQDARASSELYVLTDWADAVQRRDPAAAAAHLNLAREVGTALAATNGERLLADTVAAIDRSGGPTVDLLAQAQIAYRKGRACNKLRDVAAAVPWFQESARKFRRAGNPMAYMAEYYIANCRTDLGDVDAALASINDQLEAAPPSYQALRGYLLWQQGTAFARAGRLYEALDSYQTSLAVFDRMQEETNIDYMRTGVITISMMLGRYGEAWRERIRAFRDISRNGNPRTLQAALETTARAEATAGQWEVASAFYGLSLERELKPENPALLASASTWRILMTHRLGWSSVARDDVERARRTLGELKDPAMRDTAARRLMIAEALTIEEREPRRAVALLQQAEAGAYAHHELFDLPEILLERGRIYRSLGQEEEAIADFRKALDLSRARDRDVPDVQIRNTYFAVDEAAAEELIDILDRRNQRDDLLLVADRSRARTFRTTAATAIGALTAGIPAGTVVVHFTSLPDRLLVARIGEHGVDLHRVSISRAELQRRIAALTGEITAGDDRAARASLRAVYDLLLGGMARELDAARRLIVVPDDVVGSVPFAALVRPDGRFLVETCAIVHAPSAMFFTSAAREHRPRPAPSGGVVTVGNPRFDRRLWPDLPALAASEQEARDVRALYDRGVALIGPDATRERVVAALAQYPVADLATHGVVDPQDPARSLLLLTPGGDDRGTLYLRDVAALSLRNDLVMLAACKSSAPASGGAAAMRSFAFAFLAAGARNAVGTLWDVDDGMTRTLSTTMHSHLLREGRSAADALRLAQLSMLRSGDPARQALRSWSGFQLYGAGN